MQSSIPVFTPDGHESVLFPLKNRSTWKIVIVDADPAVHRHLQRVLGNLLFEQKALELISAYSSDEAADLLEHHPDAAIMLLEPLLETPAAGLALIQYIREEKQNHRMRIVVHTAYPEQFSEEQLILSYDINDYRTKAELTDQRLTTAIIAALRSYRDLTHAYKNKQSLKKIIESSAAIFTFQSMQKFASGVLDQLISILSLHQNPHRQPISSFAAARSHAHDDFYIVAATGTYTSFLKQSVREALPESLFHLLKYVFHEQRSMYFDHHFVGYFKSPSGGEQMIFLDGLCSLSPFDKYLIETFCSNVSIAFDNFYLNLEMEKTQKEIAFILGEIAEARSKETSHHVKRVAGYSKVLAAAYGLPEQEVDVLRMASPLHDIGKIGIPDGILNKPGRLTPEEFEIIKSHTTIGWEMLKSSNRNIMKAAAIIALQHHEKYNGRGYPHGLAGEDIHIYGRITAIADVFDALGSDRVYKKAWPLERVLDLIKEERGQHFDPRLVDIFFDQLDPLLKIRDAYIEPMLSAVDLEEQAS